MADDYQSYGNPGRMGATTLFAESGDSDAFAYLQSLLADYGLEELSPWALEQVQAGHSPTVITQQLYDQPAFQRRFKAIFARRDRGLPPISVSEVLAYERSVRGLFKAAGLPEGFYDSPEDFINFLVDDTSVAELNDRIEQYKTVSYSLDPAARAELMANYGLTEGNLLAYVINPDMALDHIQKSYRERPAIAQRIAAARVGAEARAGGFALSGEEALNLAQRGIDPASIRGAFGEIAASSELMGTLPGEVTANISRADQIAAATGDVMARERIKRKAQARAAAFSGGGSFATDKAGIGGLGSANT
ncbi:MAG TPA: hypothetical protein VMZ51_08190 [Acidimicrobiales bacterium]|nr:hypothetical protein [Acidimicrobiales bacterium]